MIIVYANRILSEVHWTMSAKINRDSLGNLVPMQDVFLSRLDTDGTSAIGHPEIGAALKHLARRAESR